MKSLLKLVLLICVLCAAVTDSSADTVTCTQPPSGMMAWWGGDNNALDTVGTNHGMLVNGLAFAPGQVNEAFSFDGVDDYVNVSDNLALSKPLTPLTNTVLGDPSAANDGSFDNHWYSFDNCGGAGNNYNSFILDLGEVKTVGQLSFYPLQASGYTIWTSDDGATWTERHTGSSPDVWTAPISIAVDGAYAARYFKYEGTNSGSACAYVGIADFKVFGSSPPDPVNITVDAWVNPVSYQSGASILNKRTTGNVGGFTLEDSGLDDGKIQFVVWVDGSWLFATSNAPLPLNTWTHVAGTYDGSVSRIYFNGLEVGSASRTGTIATVAAELQIGRNIVTGAVWNGLIDEVEMFNRALSAAEITAIYNAFSAGKCRTCTAQPADIVSWWRAEDDATDTIGSNHGTLANGATFAAGRVGRSFSFDGIDDAISVGMLNNTALNETLPFSVSAWVNSSDTAPYQVIASNYMGEGGDTGNFSTYVMINSGELHFGLNKRQLDGIDLATPISTGWHYIAATYDGTVLKLYLDGILRSSTIRDFSGSTDNTRGWYIGNYSPETVAAHGFNSSFKGLIDEVAVFNRALTDAEITAIFNASSAGICSQPTIVTYTVTFASNGGSAVSSQTVSSGSTATEPTPPTRSGYTFVGWYSDSALSTAFAFTTPITADTTLYAKWMKDAPPPITYYYTVSFTSNGGSAVNSQTVPEGGTANIPTPPTRSGYTFVGWYSDPALSTAFAFTTPITTNTTLYAKWMKDAPPPITYYTVSFTSNGGSAVNSQTVPEGGTANIPTPPTRTGYTFAGWFSNSSLTTVFTFTTLIFADTTLYAKWKANVPTYTVTPSAGTGSGITPATPQTVASGGTKNFTINATPGYGILSVSGCDGTLSGSSYTTGAITANCTVAVTAVKHSGNSGSGPDPTIADAMKSLQAHYGMITLPPAEQILYDVAPLDANGVPMGNGIVDMADVILILRRSIGIGSW